MVLPLRADCSFDLMSTFDSTTISEADIMALVVESQADRFESLSDAFNDCRKEREKQSEEYSQIEKINLNLQNQINQLRQERDRAR